MVLQTEFAQIKNNNLYIDDVKATELAKKYGTPLYVMSEGHIRHQFYKLQYKKMILMQIMVVYFHTFQSFSFLIY